MTVAAEHSVIVPIYLNEENIVDLLDALETMSEKVEGLEAVFVIDGSPDNSLGLLREALPGRPFQAQVLAHSRNFGAFPAIRSGLAAARGRFMAVMAADLQEPLELIERFFEILDADEADVVFGVRSGRRDGFGTQALAGVYWWLYRKFVVPEIPRGGVDVLACNRQVAEAVLSLGESNSSLVAQFFWVGFRREFVPYQRRAREKGTSAWSLGKRFRYMADSLFSFSDLPILTLLWLGIIGVLFSIVLGGVTLVARLAGLYTQPGFATIVVATLFLFSVLITTQGIIGMYLWRILENAKGRPTGIVMSSRCFPASDQLGRRNQLATLQNHDR
jgi:glycosyltransferase involved in cell wall biosynthesis